MREWAVCLKPGTQSIDSSKTTTEVQQNSTQQHFAKTVKFSQLTHNEHCKIEADSPSTDSAPPAKTGFNGNPVKYKKTELRKCDQGNIMASGTMTFKFKWHSIKCRTWHLCFGSSDPTGYYTSKDHGRIRHRTVNKVNGYGVDDRRQAFPFTKFNPALKARQLNGQNVKVVMHFHLRINLIMWEVLHQCAYITSRHGT